MTDKEIFTAAYEQTGIELNFYDYDGFDVCTLETGSHKIEGYSGFVTDLYFDKSGKFIKQIIAE